MFFCKGARVLYMQKTLVRVYINLQCSNFTLPSAEQNPHQLHPDSNNFRTLLGRYLSGKIGLLRLVATTQLKCWIHFSSRQRSNLSALASTSKWQTLQTNAEMKNVSQECTNIKVVKEIVPCSKNHPYLLDQVQCILNTVSHDNHKLFKALLCPKTSPVTFSPNWTKENLP